MLLPVIKCKGICTRRNIRQVKHRANQLTGRIAPLDSSFIVSTGHGNLNRGIILTKTTAVDSDDGDSNPATHHKALARSTVIRIRNVQAVFTDSRKSGQVFGVSCKAIRACPSVSVGTGTAFHGNSDGTTRSPAGGNGTRNTDSIGFSDFNLPPLPRTAVTVSDGNGVNAGA